jgi:hypothetical protein
LCVRTEQYQTAQRLLENTDVRRYHIDLHRGFLKLDIENINDLYSRSELIKICEIEARVLGAEDHLRLLCSHALGHGACRALWLCDIAVAVEKRPKISIGKSVLAVTRCELIGLPAPFCWRTNY